MAIGDVLSTFHSEVQKADAKTFTRWRVTFGPWELTIERAFVMGHPGPGFGMVSHQGGAKFMLIGAALCRMRIRITARMMIAEAEVYALEDDEA